MDSDNDSFLAAIRANLFDQAPRLIYADWLDEQNEAVKAEYVRLVVRLMEDVHHPESLNRMIQIAPTIPEVWRVAVGGCFELHFDTGDAKQLMRAVYEAMTFFTPKNRPTDETPTPESFCVVRNVTREIAESMLQEYGLAGVTRFRLFVKVATPPPLSPPTG